MDELNGVVRNRWECCVQSDEDTAAATEILSSLPVCAGRDRKALTVAARLLLNRGIKGRDALSSFFSASLDTLPDPMLLPDMEKACRRICRAIENGEKITVYGDYDVDGITSTTVLYSWLRDRGCTVDYYIPDRTDEGYGLNNGAIKSIRDSGSALLITVDTGTTAVSETAYAASIGLDIVVTDHHECKWDEETSDRDMPKCCAVVNPKRPDSRYPFPDLAGVGVVFKLLCALEGNASKVFDRCGDLVTLGTIADIMPLREENRVIVSLGLEKMRKKTSVGISALLSASGSDKPMDSSVVAYRIAPRLNAAGRIGDPSVSVRLLLSSDRHEADILAAELCEENRRRQQKEQEIFADVVRMIEAGGTPPKVVIASSPEWHNGVIGIVASRVTERYRRPCILFCQEGDNLKGSARSVPGVSIYQLLLSASDILVKFGGHEMAAGLTLRAGDYDRFVERMQSVAEDTVTEEALIGKVKADCRLSYEELDFSCCDAVSLLEPYGAGNPVPVFELDGVRVSGMENVGSGRHLRMSFSDPGNAGRDIYAVWFNHNVGTCDCCEGGKADVMLNVSDSYFNGRRRLNLSVRDMRPTSEEMNQRERQTRRYENFISGADNCICLTRADVTAVYRHLRQISREGRAEVNLFSLSRAVSMTGRIREYAETRLCLDVLQQVGILTYKGTVLCTVQFPEEIRKADLKNSSIWLRAAAENE